MLKPFAHRRYSATTACRSQAEYLMYNTDWLNPPKYFQSNPIKNEEETYQLLPRFIPIHYYICNNN